MGERLRLGFRYGSVGIRNPPSSKESLCPNEILIPWPCNIHYQYHSDFRNLSINEGSLYLQYFLNENFYARVGRIERVWWGSAKTIKSSEPKAALRRSLSGRFGYLRLVVGHEWAWENGLWLGVDWAKLRLMKSDWIRMGDPVYEGDPDAEARLTMLEKMERDLEELKGKDMDLSFRIFLGYAF